MDFTKLITRNQYEKVARARGYRQAHLMSYTDLERIAIEAEEENRALYKRAREKEAQERASLPASFVLVPSGTDVEVMADREEELQVLMQELAAEEALEQEWKEAA